MVVDGHVSSPMLREIFAPSESPEFLLERFLNFVLVLLAPLALVVAPLYFVLRRRGFSAGPLTRGRARLLAGAVVSPAAYVLLRAAQGLLAVSEPGRSQLARRLWALRQGFSAPLFRTVMITLIALLLIYTVLVLIAGAVLKHWGLTRRTIPVCVLLFFVALAAVPFFEVQARLDTTDYLALAEEARVTKGRSVLMPPVPFGPFTQTISYMKPDRTHLMGTDKVGRDVLARVIHGARVSLSVGFLAVSIAVMIGIVVGSVSAYHGGWVDLSLQRVVEVVICFPTFLLILTIMAFIEKRSIFNVMLVIGLTGWTGVARLVRGQMLQQKKLDYVTAAQAVGVSSWRIMFRHLLPNSVAPVLVSVTFGIAGAILTESGLSFLGFGVSPPTASWGELLNQALAWPTGYWWLTTWPGFLIFFSVTIYNLVGEGLRDALDPRLRF